MQCVNWSSALMCSRHSSIAQDLSHVLCQDSYTLPMATWESETITETGVALQLLVLYPDKQQHTKINNNIHTKMNNNKDKNTVSFFILL